MKRSGSSAQGPAGGGQPHQPPARGVGGFRTSRSVQAASPRGGTAPAHAAAQAASTKAAKPHGYEAELEAAVKAVRRAGELCVAVQRKLGGLAAAERDGAQGLAGETQAKEDTSPVTVADYGAQAVISVALQRELAGRWGFSMVAEEDSADLLGDENRGLRARITELVNAALAGEEGLGPLSEADVLAAIDAGGSEGGHEGKHWVLDPIDGTRGFVAGRQYAIALGLLDGGEPVLGVMGCPNMPQAPMTQRDGTSTAVEGVDGAGGAGVGCIFAAVKGRGTFVGPLSEGMPKRAASVEDLQSEEAVFMESVEAKHSNHEFSGRVAKILKVTNEPLRVDSQAKYGAIARGDASIFMRFPPATYREKIWDHAAGAIIIQEAGGLVSDAAGKPLDFSKGRWLDIDGGIVAAPPTIHPQLIAAIAEAKETEAQAAA